MTDSISLPPYSRLPSSPPQTRSVNVVVFIPSIAGSGETAVHIKDLPLPLEFKEISKRLIEAGFKEPTTLASRHRCHDIIVTEGPSGHTNDGGWHINVDQPLLHFYHKVFLASDGEDKPPPYVNEAKLTEGDDTVLIDDLKIRFHRTIRVPDNDKTHALPPDMGKFKLFNIGEAHTAVPKHMLAKDGAFISMYQREAMWMSFNLQNAYPVAVKISVGGVNALTGLPQNVRAKGKQDYLPIGGGHGQLWPDGISTSPGVVRQFVAMPLGKGYTVEEQLTGSENVGGIQIDLFPKYDTQIKFSHLERDVNMYKTARQLGLKAGDSIQMMPYARSIMLTKASPPVVDPQHSLIELTANDESAWVIYVKALTGATLDIVCRSYETTEVLKRRIQERVGIPPDQQRLIFAGKQLQHGDTLSGETLFWHRIVLLWLTLFSDVLSFYKEELAGESTNQISAMAARKGVSKVEQLVDTSGELCERIIGILDVSPRSRSRSGDLK
ncbi:hypothetical protein BU15DRAFT_76769 [Melanogaster broomeanus]|nr:hypothetical protein BU15DRAFT_76769 [Melanogaster broomeanus]